MEVIWIYFHLNSLFHLELERYLAEYNQDREELTRELDAKQVFNWILKHNYFTCFRTDAPNWRPKLTTLPNKRMRSARKWPNYSRKRKSLLEK